MADDFLSGLPHEQHMAITTTFAIHRDLDELTTAAIRIVKKKQTEPCGYICSTNPGS